MRKKRLPKVEFLDKRLPRQLIQNQPNAKEARFSAHTKYSPIYEGDFKAIKVSKKPEKPIAPE